MKAADETFPPVELTFVGVVGGREAEMVAHSGIEWAHIHMIYGGPVHGVNPLRMLLSALKLGIGFVQSVSLMIHHRPERVFLTGGWASLPVTLAAWLFRVPIVSFVPDIEPGLTLKVASRFARKVAATTGDTEVYFRPGQVVATGYPLRRRLLEATRAAAIEHFGLDPAMRTLLIVGGSTGARSINRAVIGFLPELLADETLQVLHITGRLDWEEVKAARDGLSIDEQSRYHAFDYLHDDMGLALAVADIAVSRSGASALGELTQFGLPAILVPYPYAWRYQKVNADFLTNRGAALSVDDFSLGEDLLPAIRRLLDEPSFLRQMAERARILAQPDGASNIARLLITLEGQ